MLNLQSPNNVKTISFSNVASHIHNALLGDGSSFLWERAALYRRECRKAQMPYNL